MAQQTAPATAEAEKALRARAEQFYQLEVDGKFRQAEAFVAEDTKDYFYNNGKPDLKAVKIDSIDFSPDGTHATLHLTARVVWKAPGMMAQELSTKAPATWKLENGQWCLYIDQSPEIDTPFGKFRPGVGGPGGSPLPSGLPNPTDMDTMVTADRTSVVLTNGDRTPQTVTVTNHLPGAVKIAVGTTLPTGLNAELDKKDLASGEKAIVSLRAEGDAKPAGDLHISIGPLPDLIIKITTR